MRVKIFRPAVLFSVFFASTSLLLSKVDLEVSKQSYFTARDFQRIPEFFSGEEYRGGKIYCRSNPKEREGFYFVVTIPKIAEKLARSIYWQLKWISPLDPAMQTIKIPMEEPKFFGKEIFIGLTGKDWPEPTVRPLAWHLCLMEGQDTVIAESQSFLWSK